MQNRPEVLEMSKLRKGICLVQGTQPRSEVPALDPLPFWNFHRSVAIFWNLAIFWNFHRLIVLVKKKKELVIFWNLQFWGDAATGSWRVRTPWVMGSWGHGDMVL